MDYKALQKNVDMQVLRAIAIIMVIYQHYRVRLPSPDWYLNSFGYITTWTGVDIFLALSGFLMYRMIDKEISRNGRTVRSFGNFLIKRVARLYPVLIVWVLISIPASAYIEPFFGADKLLAIKSAVPSLFAYSNFHWYNCVITNSQCGASDISGITWSLSLEWQLYISLFVMMFFARGRVLIALLLASLALAFFIKTGTPAQKFVAWWTRPQAFIFGVLLAISASKIKYNLSRILRGCITAASIILICLAPVYAPAIVLPIVIGALGAICLACSVQGDLFGNGFLSKVMTWIGDRSYSIYLCHLTVIHCFAKLLRDHNSLSFISNNVLLTFVIAIVLILTAANISYKYVELTFINLYKNRNIKLGVKA